jgi:uncharacterized protein (DUF885 family)
MISRRDLLAGAVAAGATLPFAGCASSTLRNAEGREDVRLGNMLERHAQALRDFDGGGDSLGDYSLAGRARAAAANAARLAELATIDRLALSPPAAIDYDTAHFIYQAMDGQYGRYGFSDINLRPSPYVVSQMNGAYYWLPDSIGARSALSDSQAADRYLSKLHQFAAALDHETERIAHDAELGVIPPAFILAKTVAQIATLRDTPALSNPLLATAVEQARAAGLDDVEQHAIAFFQGSIAPALTRQIDVLAGLAPRATDQAGIWAKPDGQAYYASALHSNTTASYAPGELHRLGLDWVGELSIEIDDLLSRQGMSAGTVGERLMALDRDPRFLKPDSDAGREQIIDAANARLKAIGKLLPRAFTVRPDDPVEVRRVSPAIEDGAPGGFYSASRNPDHPSVIFINLRSVEENALWRIPTLLHHEGIPGHHFQASVLGATDGLSMFRQTVRFSAWTEGWALYAEQLADEIGAYEDDPFGRIGYLQGQLFRACRVVVDTGLHHSRWTREQAISWMMAHGGESRDAAEREIDRYCVYPGQACSFKVGQQQILACRERVRAVLGARFDLRAYNDIVLASGPLPMEVLEAVTTRWAQTRIENEQGRYSFSLK